MEPQAKIASLIYEDRAGRFAERRDRCAARLRRLAHLRLAAFAGALTPFLLPVDPPAWASLGWWAISGAFLLVFLSLIVAYNALERRRRWYDELVQLNREGTARLARDWERLPELPESAAVAAPADGGDPVALDLDLFGRASLFSLMGTVATPPGRARLRDWMLEPAGAEAVGERQAAVDELAPLIELRERIAVHGRLMGAPGDTRLEAFLAWAEEAPPFSPAIIWTARVLPALPISLIALNVAGLVSYLAWLAALAFNLTVSFSLGKRVHTYFQRTNLHEQAVEGYAELLGVLATCHFHSPLLSDLVAQVSGNGVSAHEEMKRLHRLVLRSELRHSMLYLPIQALTLWDFHVADRLQRWQLRAGRRARDWLRALGTVDALAAAATVRYDNPSWTYPDVSETMPPRLEAVGLGHPLLPDDVRVGNDVELGPPGTFLFVTGSNMSGKSTLLRAIGTNVVLARTGAPVCATRMRLPPVALQTSMRVHDSLQRGLSHFMAELERLRQVIDAARAADAEGETLLYLLDDILQGTNTAERRTAVRVIVHHLLRERAIGCVTSHDLTLAEGGELAEASRAVHFTERVEEGPEGANLTFDYKLRPGIATSKNALKLLEMIGLEADGSGEPDIHRQG